MRIFFLTIFISFIPMVVFGADFYALAPIPGITDTEPTSLGQYINNVFNLAITIGAILAVIRIIIAGFQYITTEAVGEKKNSREIIAQAIFGLVLLMSVTLILNLINGDITKLSLLDFKDLRYGSTYEFDLCRDEGCDTTEEGYIELFHENQSSCETTITRDGVEYTLFGNGLLSEGGNGANSTPPGILCPYFPD